LLFAFFLRKSKERSFMVSFFLFKSHSIHVLYTVNIRVKVNPRMDIGTIQTSAVSLLFPFHSPV
jgi:hypothetical protein